jgi:predicted nucleotidyltransferase
MEKNYNNNSKIDLIVYAVKITKATKTKTTAT